MLGLTKNADWPLAGQVPVLGNIMSDDGLDPDAALMLRVKAGDLSAFESLVDRYKQPVLGVVYRIVRDPDEAEDIAQNVFIQVFKSAHRYRVEARFSTWLFTIARNLSLNELRRRSRHPADSLERSGSENQEGWTLDLEDVRDVGPTDQLLRQELERKVEECLMSLPEPQRTAMELCRSGESSYEEIAEIIGCSLSATKSIIHRARGTLKDRLKPYLLSGDWRTEPRR